MAKDFKIVIPGGCNAKCKFCFAQEATVAGDRWLDKLEVTLNSATDDFKELNITGGEPTASPYLFGALEVIRRFRHKFTRVVMTTNGYKLDPKILAGAVDHLNISRHHAIDMANEVIFGTDTVPTEDKLRSLIKDCNDIGIDVSLSMMLTNNLVAASIMDMVSFAHSVGASALKVRQDYFIGLDPSPMEKMFNHIKSVHEVSCPVCRVKTQLIKGMRVSWHTGVMEPSDIIKDYAYEIIFQPSGELTLDYSGKKPFSFRTPIKVESKIVGYKEQVSCVQPRVSAVSRSYNTVSSCGGGSGCG